MKMTKFVLALLLASSTIIATAADKAPVLEKSTCGKFDYPKAALINEETGVVLMSLLVAADGTVTDSKLEKSSGSKTLDKAAVKIYSTCKYSPATKDGKSEQAWTKIEHVWSLT
jgi:periplasmic protein TonB